MVNPKMIVTKLEPENDGFSYTLEVPGTTVKINGWTSSRENVFAEVDKYNARVNNILHLNFRDPVDRELLIQSGDIMDDNGAGFTRVELDVLFKDNFGPLQPLDSDNDYCED